MMTRALFVSASSLLSALLLGGVARAGEPEADATAEAAREPTGPRVVGKLEAGGAYRQIFTLPVLGAEASLGFGVQPRVLKSGVPEAFFLARYAYGKTEQGLAVHVVRTGGQGELALGRFRASMGFELIWLGLDRVTVPGLVQHWGIGLSAGASIDLIQTSEHQALYLGSRFMFDVFPHTLVPRTVSPAGSLDVGYRF